MQQAKMFAATSCGPGAVGKFAKCKSIISHFWLIVTLIVIAISGIDCEQNKNCE